MAYLEGGAADPAASLLLGSSPTLSLAGGAVAYFADSMEGLGRWLGRGAARLGLAGAVTRDALASVLTGRDPTTGARLLTAQGSTRRAHLAVGAPERRAGDAWVYAVADVAWLLGVSKVDVNGWIQHGDRLQGSGDPRANGWITAITGDDGERLVTEHEVARVEQLLTTGADPARIAAGGAEDEVLTIAEAARALNVSARYVRRVCANHERLQAHPSSRARMGGPEQSLPCRRGTRRGAFEIRRGDLVAFAVARTPPVARVGFDVTLTERLKALMALSPSAKTASAVAAARQRLIEAYANLWRPRTVLRGEKVLGGISTTQHLPMALPYGEGGYVYAIQLRSGGFDFTDVSPNLREVNAIDIDPIDVIAAAGPLKDVTDGGRYGELDAGEWEAGRVFINPASTVGGAVTRQALDAMHGHISLQGRQRVRPPGGQSKDDDPSL